MLTPMNRAGGLPANLKLRGDSNPHGSAHHALTIIDAYSSTARTVSRIVSSK